MTIRMQPTVICDNCGSKFQYEFSHGDRPHSIRQVTRSHGWRLARDSELGHFVDLCATCVMVRR